MLDPYKEQYRGFLIVAQEQAGAWQARAPGLVALSSLRATAPEAVGEIKSYLDDQAEALEHPSS